MNETIESLEKAAKVSTTLRLIALSEGTSANVLQFLNTAFAPKKAEKYGDDFRLDTGELIHASTIRAAARDELKNRKIDPDGTAQN